MKANWILGIALAGMVPIAVLASADAQVPQAQIPTMQVCNNTAVKGGGTVKLVTRSDATHAGSFKLKVSLSCGSVYPEGVVTLVLDMTDSFKGEITSTQLDQVTSAGKSGSLAYVSGRCKGGDIRGCRFWLMVADNPKDQLGDVAGFLVFDGSGKRVAHGAGQLDEGNIDISASGF